MVNIIGGDNLMRKSGRSDSSILLQVFARFRMWTGARPGVLRFFIPIILFVVLLAPSVWMLTIIPPLWRDIDAYLQLTRPPGPETLLQYGPLYCFVARIPLYVGYSIDRFQAGAPFPALSFFIHPVLTDSGVFMLLLLQHLSLCFATFHLIAKVTRLFWVRFALAGLWAANPLFYTLAHCVGGETLSMILVLLIGATGLKMIRHSRTIPKKEWVLFGMLMWLCILTRHINAVLAALLPLTFVLLGICRFIGTRFARLQSVCRWNRLRSMQAVQKAAIAVAVGVSCIALANVSLRTLCYAGKTPYYSVAGFTFLGRLKFLAALSLEQRNQLLDRAAKNTNSADVKKLISQLRNEFTAGPANWDTAAFKKRAEGLLFPPQGDFADQQKFHTALNSMVRAFLWPPEKILLTAVVADFQRAQRITIPEVVASLFGTTRFYFSHRDVMSQCASLITFRNRDADQIVAIFKKHSYFRHPKNLRYHALLLIGIVLLGVLLLTGKTCKRQIAGTASYVGALIVIGLLMMFANCLVAVFQPPRYTLPMWELTIVSVMILLGGIMDALLALSRHESSSGTR
jgi:hypothetical protein